MLTKHQRSSTNRICQPNISNYFSYRCSKIISSRYLCLAWRLLFQDYIDMANHFHFINSSQDDLEDVEEDNEQQEGDSLQGENGNAARYIQLTVSWLCSNLKTLIFNYFSQDLHNFICHYRRNLSNNTSAQPNGSGNDAKYPSTTSKSKVSKP